MLWLFKKTCKAGGITGLYATSVGVSAYCTQWYADRLDPMRRDAYWKAVAEDDGYAENNEPASTDNKCQF